MAGFDPAGSHLIASADVQRELDSRSRAEAIAPARDAWARGELESALVHLCESGVALEPEGRALVADIANVSTAAERTLLDLHSFVGSSEVSPGRLRIFKLRQTLESRFDSSFASESPAPRVTTRALRTKDEIHARLCGALPSDPNRIEAIYARNDWVLIERCRDNADLWWRRQAIWIPQGRDPSALVYAGYKLRQVIRHQLRLHMHKAAWMLRSLIPAGLRRRLKHPLAPLLRPFGMGPASSATPE
jgi:hypothetical protein